MAVGRKLTIYCRHKLYRHFFAPKSMPSSRLCCRARDSFGGQSIIDFISISHALLVAEHLSFSRAALVLGIRQSAVSRRIQALEDKLGVSLFERHRGGVRLTVAGRRFLDKARSAISDLDHAVKGAANAGCGADGLVRVGIFSSISQGFVRDLLRAYREAHPTVTIELTEGSPREHIARICERRLDIALVKGTPPAPGCETEVLGTARLFLALPENHWLAAFDSIEWEALMDEHFIISRDATSPEMHNHIVKRLADFGFNPSIERHGVGPETLMHMVALGFGISLVTETNVATKYPEIVFRPLAAADDVISCSAVWWLHNDNPALRRLLSLARSMSAGRALPATLKNVA
ncbi:MAG: LysR family transcriptional regulator [Methylovirgula sp.]